VNNNRTYNYLSDEQIKQFLDKGYIRISEAFTKEQAAWMLKDVWVRLGANPNDKSTWPMKTHLPRQRSVLVKDFAPKAWGAIVDLLGDESIIDARGQYWYDSFIINLGRDDDKWEPEDRPEHPQDLNNWHVDGDFFLHFLDSPEQALLVIPIFSDEIVTGGGGTYIAPDSIPIIAKKLEANPYGTMPGKDFNHPKTAHGCKEFVEVTGKCGDVILMHPLMLHSASPNLLRTPRFITNPRVCLNTPFIFNKPLEEYSLVELKTLKALGRDKPFSYEIKSERRRFPGKRDDLWIQMQKDGEKRLREFGTFASFEGNLTVPRGY